MPKPPSGDGISGMAAMSWNWSSSLARSASARKDASCGFIAPDAFVEGGVEVGHGSTVHYLGEYEVPEVIDGLAGIGRDDEG